MKCSSEKQIMPFSTTVFEKKKPHYFFHYFCETRPIKHFKLLPFIVAVEELQQFIIFSEASKRKALPSVAIFYCLFYDVQSTQRAPVVDRISGGGMLISTGTCSRCVEMRGGRPGQ